MQERNRPPTIRHVAEAAGVSTATVSRVINGSAFVEPDTLQRVQQAIKATRYVPNLVAGQLAAKRARLVAALVPGIAYSLFNATIETMAKELGMAGFSVLLGFATEGEPGVNDVVMSTLARRPDGLILTGAVEGNAIRRALRERGVTVIETWDLPATPIDVAIGFSHSEVGRALAKFVLESGRRRPLLISMGTRRARIRTESFLESWRSGGGAPPKVDTTAAGGRWSGRERLAFHLASGERPDVVVCSSDLIAQGVLFEAMARGLRVPDDLAIVGFGGSELASVSYPSLTTVKIDGAEIGRQAAAVLIGRSKECEPPQKRIDVGFRILPGGSL